MYKLYSMQRSGNSYKVRLALALLNAPYRAIEIDILRGESRTPDFLAMNPSGQVPLLEVESGRFLAESNAILWYVAGGTSLAPDTRIERAEALQWMFFEQHALSPISARPISGCRWSRAGARCRPTRWKTGWSAAMPRCR
jgi:glutathione S-transferase